jgi:hypothetical protein
MNGPYRGGRGREELGAKRVVSLTLALSQRERG